jgi:hypothetical protein
VGTDHRLADRVSLAVMLMATEQRIFHRSEYASAEKKPVQLKSSQRPFSLAQVRRWAADLEA